MEPTELEVIRESTSSIELTRAKDNTYAWKVKIYFDASDPTAVEAAKRTVSDTDEWLRGHYLNGEAA